MLKPQEFFMGNDRQPMGEMQNGNPNDVGGPCDVTEVLALQLGTVLVRGFVAETAGNDHRNFFCRETQQSSGLPKY